MLEKQLPSKKARVQMEIHNDGLYVAIYDHEDEQGVRTLFKVAIEDLIKDFVKSNLHKESISNLLFELDCVTSYLLSVQNKKECERDVKDFADSGFGDDFGTDFS
tara:strand:- start:16716 stop:17030 length:315 start_codon:yes stop_codon:yes gene_type:complete